MSYRFMRIIVMFDLPSCTTGEQREYRKFRKFLIKNGFIMMQESIYTKLVLHPSAAELVKTQVRKAIPKEGLIQMLTVTEKQFANMELLIGEMQSTYVENDKRLIEL